MYKTTNMKVKIVLHLLEDVDIKHIVTSGGLNLTCSYNETNKMHYFLPLFR